MFVETIHAAAPVADQVIAVGENLSPMEIPGAGWLFVVDRSSDVINAAGYKIWPFEVEQVLTTHPAVREAAVVDIVDDYRGQSTRAYVALEQGYVATAAELIEYSRARLAAYKYPREIEIVEALPRTATGKLLRRQLRAE